MARPPGRSQAVIVEAVRTLYGRRGGALAAWHPLDLSAEVLSALVERSGVSPSDIGEVIWGCTSQVGAQASNMGRRAVLAAGWPEQVPGATVDGHAASSAQAVHWAAQAVMAGAQEIVVAGGAELNSSVPLGAALAQPAVGKPLGARLTERYRDGGGLLPPGLVAERVAADLGLSRRRLDDWARWSVDKAARAQPAGTPFIVVPGGAAAPRRPLLSPAGALRGGNRGAARRAPAPVVPVGPLDEGVAYSLGAARMEDAPPLYVEGGVVTAANVASEGDGAAAVLVASATRAAELGLVARARFVSVALAGVPPDRGPLALGPATRQALERAGLDAGEIGRWHVLELSAVAVLAWADELRVELARVNPEGGELAVTCPVGAAGAGLFANAVSGLHLHPSEGRFAGVCATGDGGVATACIIESLR